MLLTAGGQDGSDADGWGGQMSVDPSAGVIDPQVGCSATGITLGSSSSFNQQTGANSLTLLVAGSSASTNCYWDLTGIGISQTIPPEQTPGSYSIDMILTVTAI